MPNTEGNPSSPLWISLSLLMILLALGYFGREIILSKMENFDFYILLVVIISVSLCLLLYQAISLRHENNFYVERKTKELVKSRDFFLRLFDDSPVPYFMVDKKGLITLPNKAAQRLFSKSAEELLSKPFYELLTGEYVELGKRIYQKFSHGVASTDEELLIKSKSKKNRWVLISALPYKSLGVRTDGGVISMHDITEQKAVDKVKSEFVSLASHQLRTPLTAMKWYGEMMLKSEDPLTKKQRHRLEKIYNGNERMIDLVNLLLSASRLELGTLSVDITNVNPINLVKTILDELQVKIQKNSIQIVEKYDGDPTSFNSDKKLLLMIIQNLLTNAVKYSKEGGHVSIEMIFNTSGMNFNVKDNGVGIPKEQQDRIFTKMFRADNARQSNTEGTGLGLYIVWQAVEALGGEISFSSEEGKGTVFSAVLPSGTVEKSTVE